MNSGKKVVALVKQYDNNAQVDPLLLEKLVEVELALAKAKIMEAYAKTYPMHKQAKGFSEKLFELANRIESELKDQLHEKKEQPTN